MKNKIKRIFKNSCDLTNRTEKASKHLKTVLQFPKIANRKQRNNNHNFIDFLRKKSKVFKNLFTLLTK